MERDAVDQKGDQKRDQEHEQELKRIRRQAELEATKRQAEAKAETEKYEIYHQLSAKHNELVQRPGLLASSV